MTKRKPLADAFKRSNLTKENPVSLVHSIDSLEVDNDSQLHARPFGQPLQTQGSEGGANNMEDGTKEQEKVITASQDVTSSHETMNTVQYHKAKVIGATPTPLITRSEVEIVPGPKGERIPADKPVNMTFTVSAKERYLWNLELSRRGLTGVSVLRDAMNHLLDEG